MEDLKRVGHIGGPGDAGQVALHLRRELEPLLLVLGLLLARPLLVRDLAPLDDTDAGVDTGSLYSFNLPTGYRVAGS